MPQPYQLALITPGISPRSAICRKHILHKPKSRRNARALPHRLQRLYLRAENFGFFLHLFIIAFRATTVAPLR